MRHTMKTLQILFLAIVLTALAPEPLFGQPAATGGNKLDDIAFQNSLACRIIDADLSLVAQLCAGETAPAKMQNSVRESVATQGYSAAECYQKGMEAYRSRNYATAATWLEKAAESNYAAAYFPLAECYDLSESPVLDEEKACRWYMRAIGSADESSREYWHACLRIAEYFEFGKGGLERNYDSALYFYGRFRQNTLAQNRTVADSCIARVKEKQNRGSQAEVAASTPGSVPASSENVVRGHENFAPVSLPAYGTIPETPQALYYLNTKGQGCEIRLTTSAQGVFVSFFPSTLLKSSACLSDQSGDKFVFSEYKFDTRPISNGFGQYTPHVGVIFGRPLLSISKDWRRVTIHTLAYECDIPVTEADYKRFLEAKRDFIMGGAPGGAGGAGANRSGSSIDTDTDGQFPGNKHGYYTCPNCHGTGRCPHCDGKKITGNPYLGGEPMVCAPCNGKGKCASCDGTGKKYGVVH